MSQPTWKLLWSTDTEALYTDETGVYDPELAILSEYETRRGTTRYLVHRVVLDLCDPATLDQEWFASDLAEVAECCDHASIREDLCSQDPSKRAHAYQSLGSYHGWDNFDHPPQDLTPSEVKNWPDLDGKPEVTISVSEDDDGQVTLYCNDQEAARDAQSVLESRWEVPGDMDVAYASVMDRADLVEALEAEGYEVDSSEWSSPDAQDFAFWEAKYERSEGATPERLREILGWRTLDDVRACRRVQDAVRAWWTDAECAAYERACYDAGWVLDLDPEALQAGLPRAHL